MKIKSAKSAQGTQASQGVAAGKPASQGADGAGLNLGQEFKGIMESFAGGLNQPSAEISLDTFQVDPLAYAAKIATQPTEVQIGMQASALAQSSQTDLADLPQKQDTKEQAPESSPADAADAAPIEVDRSLPGEVPSQEKSSIQHATEESDNSSAPSGDGKPATVESDVTQAEALSETVTEQPTTADVEPAVMENFTSAPQISVPSNISAGANSSAALARSSTNTMSGSSQVATPQPAPTVATAAPGTTSEPGEAQLREALGQVLTAFEPAGGAPKNQLQANPAIPVFTQILKQNALQEMMQSAPLAGQQVASAANAEAASRSLAAQNGSPSANLINAAGAVSTSRGGASSEARTQRSLPSGLATRTFERVEQTLKEVARSKDGKSISLHLNPSELGQVKVDVTLREGTLHARLAAENPQVAQLLRDRAQELQVMLRKLGLNVDKITVAVHSDGQFFSQLEQNLTDKERHRQSDGGKPQSGGDISFGSFAPGKESAPGVGNALDHWVA